MEPSLSPSYPQSPLNSSFPSPLPTSGSQQAPSIISSRMTDIASEDGNEFQKQVQATGGRPNTAASVDPNRPGSAMSSQTRPSTRAPPSRRGLGSPTTIASWRMGGAFEGPGGSMTNSSRPPSATSRTSRTHVPSLASHAFFRPMSSQRLQAQRGFRPARVGPPSASVDGSSEAGTNTNRHSMVSDATSQQGPQIQHNNDIPPPSRGTEFTEQDDGVAINASPTENATLQIKGESERPLRSRSPHSRPMQLDIDNQGNGSPKSFRANFHRAAITRKETQGHERLSSSNNSPTFAEKLPEAAPKTGINYQYFSGNTVFCWGGRLQNARDRPINLASGIIVVLPTILFLVYSGPYLSQHVSPALPFFFAYLFFICISSFVHASVTDPGILPRNLHPLPPSDKSDDPLTLGPPTTKWTMIKSAGTPNGAMDVPTKYCKTCNIWRPPRCHHCRICDSCIETQDHHCVWINNCVGRRNYRYFFTFVSSGTLLGIFLTFASLGHCLRYQTEQRTSFSDSIHKWRIPFAMFIYGLLATPYPACLWGYHLWLIARGETTREYLNSHKFVKNDRHRPFTQVRAFKNWVVVLLRPRPPTYLRFKQKYEEGDQRFGARRGKRQAPLAADQQGGGMELQDVGGTSHIDQ